MISKKMHDMISRPSPIRAMFEDGKLLAAKYGAENVYDFSLGNPNTAAPEAVKQAIIDILDNEPSTMVHGYMSNPGYEDVRQAVADNLNARYGAALGMRNIVMTVGAAGGLNTLFKVLLDPGDEVAVFAPFFGEYRNYANNFDAVLTVVPPNPPSFLPNPEAFAAAITPKTKAVIVNTPNNPTGVVYGKDTLTAIAAVLSAKEKEYGNAIYLISDEPYREIVYDGATAPYIPDFYPDTIIGYSYSKSLSLPGERIGYLVIPDCVDCADEIIRAAGDATRILGFVNAPSLMQRAVAKCQSATTDVGFYKTNRDILYTALTNIGYNCVKPQGAFYLWVQSLIPDDGAFCAKAKDFNLLIVPGSGFGAKGWFRIAYCVATATVQNSIQAFAKLAEFYKS